MTLSNELAAAVAQFRAVHPELYRPEEARERCYNIPHEFVYLLTRRKITAEVVDGVKADGKLIICGHFAVSVRGVVIDWTARQFDENADVPRVLTLAQWREEWPELGDAIADADKENPGGQ